MSEPRTKVAMPEGFALVLARLGDHVLCRWQHVGGRVEYVVWALGPLLAESKYHSVTGGDYYKESLEGLRVALRCLERRGEE